MARAATGAWLLRVERPAVEVSLNFLDRADGLLHWILGLVVPAGFLGVDSESVVPQLRAAIATQLADAIAEVLRERADDLARTEAVAFYPDGVRTEDGAAGRSLVGDLVLEIGHVDEVVARLAALVPRPRKHLVT